MKKNTLNFLIGSAMVLSLGACDKAEDVVDLNFTSSVVIEFDHLVNGRKIQQDAEYKNALDQDFTVNVLRYFVSNIQLVRPDGSTYVVPKDESYFLINAFEESGAGGSGGHGASIGRSGEQRAHGDGGANTEENKQFTEINLSGIPAGIYNKLIFTLGVDEEKSKSPVEQRTGVLDPTIGHNYWAWNSGYVFFALEGVSSVAHPDAHGKYRYHIGGFGGYDPTTPTANNIKIIEVDLTQKGAIELLDRERQSQVHLFVHVDRVFNGAVSANNINISEISTIMSITDNSVKVANNYARLFVHDHTHN